ncbi:uncharacterized protein Triagg1_10574 [Trichoderma aggressivum f. europaeum]|uniref:SSCRP protein n=1 Tax=Trichoderma aggressivum f. europaeum TaxID=173218 RepID=A0AAE1IZX8_9HYPO|nr:hypothetical protein Triagg1_10574 [Trichoderma aggressivum f. europaeum]
MASIAKTLAVLAFGLGLRVSAAGSRGGSLDFFSDDKCQHRIQAETAPISLDVCMPASPLGELSRSFRVDEKPYCPDGSRPSLLFFQDCACTDGIANYIPNANYGDYGNGSCQAMWGGEYLMFALSCGEFKAPVRSVISFAATFPSSATTTKPLGCPPLTSDASATAPSSATSGASDAASASAQATPTQGSSSSSQQGAANASSPSSSTGTRTRVVQPTGTSSQTAATTTSAAMGRHHEMGIMYWVGYAGIFGVVSFMTL